MSTTPWPHHDKVEEHPKAETGNSTGSETPAKTWTGAFGHACGVLLQAIAEGKAVDPESSRQMVEILEQQKFNEGIPAGLPPGILVAHKTGEITKIHHDAAIIYAKRPYVLVILVRGLTQIKDSSALMAAISREFYQATQP